MSVVLSSRKSTRVRHVFTADDLPFKPIGGETELHVLLSVKVTAEVSHPYSDHGRQVRGNVDIIERELCDFNASTDANGDGYVPEWVCELIREKHAEELIDAALAKIGDMDVDDALLNAAGQ